MPKSNRSLFLRDTPSSRRSTRQLKDALIFKAYDILDKFWWYVMPGPTIIVKWPAGNNGWIPMDYLGARLNSADPNDHYRPVLEYHCGKQFVGWHWKAIVSNHKVDTIEIKFRFDKKQWATIFALQWA
jgi:hypothetical protein